jgi:hypothetical protein
MKPRFGKWLAAAAVLLVIAIVLVGSSVMQNLEVRGRITALLTAIQRQNTDLLTNEFYPTIDQKHYDVIYKHRLYGWKITAITGQPWPMDTGTMESVKIELYVALPDAMMQPDGPYASVTNGYGPCAVVPITLRYRHLNNGDWFVMPPHFDQAIDWPCPYIVPKTPPAEPAQ